MGKARSTFRDKVLWMVDHTDMWLGWPANSQFTDDQIKKAMVKDGLISPNSNSYDILDFGKLVAEARQELRRRHCEPKH